VLEFEIIFLCIFLFCVFCNPLTADMLFHYSNFIVGNIIHSILLGSSPIIRSQTAFDMDIHNNIEQSHVNKKGHKSIVIALLAIDWKYRSDVK
jgi:hypothetical protein